VTSVVPAWLWLWHGLRGLWLSITSGLAVHGGFGLAELWPQLEAHDLAGH
jgi:hypothetical protein